MTTTALCFHFHPLSSFCQKVLIALYEYGAPFEPRIVNLGDPEERAAYLAMWPMGKIPVLRDREREQVVPETSIQIEYLEQHYADGPTLFPADRAERLEARFWDRFFDLYVEVPMQKIVGDRLRPEDKRDPQGVADARSALWAAYEVIERQIAGKTWATGEQFTVADCAAAPALFFAGMIEPFGEHRDVAAYFERLVARPSVTRVLAEAQPFFQYFPYYEAMPARFRDFGKS
jgi:glutathione S-transferase